MTDVTYRVVSAGVRHSDEFAELAKALVAAQADLEPVTKDSLNPHFKSKYVSLDAIVEAVRKPLADRGLAIVQGACTPNGDAALTVETLLIHTSGEWMSNTVVVPMAKIDPQGAGGALTYGRRYGLSALLSLATEEDDDANAATAKPAAVPPKRAPAKPAAGAQPAKAEPKATAGQVADIEALVIVAVEGGASSKGIVGQMIADYGTPNVPDLTRDQAENMLERLKASAERERYALGDAEPVES